MTEGLRITINMGYVTNSSSVIHFFDKRVLEHPKVATFISKYGLADGTPTEIWYRSACHCLVTEESTFDRVASEFKREEDEWDYGIDISDMAGKGLVIYGDEYHTIFAELSELISEACEELGLASDTRDYN